MSRAFRCRFCGPLNDLPAWRLDRRGDAVVDWACDLHLVIVAAGLQRDGERTELVLTAFEGSDRDA
jgi:hypothetical protein